MDEQSKHSNTEDELPSTTPKAYRLPASSVDVDFFGEGLSDKKKDCLKDLKDKSDTLGDFMKKMALLGKRTESIETVNFVRRSQNEYSVDFTRPSLYGLFTSSQGTHIKANVFGLADFFDTASAGLLFKIPSNTFAMSPLKFHSVFSYSIPFNIQDEYKFFKFSLYHANAYRVINRQPTRSSSVVGTRISSSYLGSLSAYAKIYPKNEHSAPNDKLIFRYYNRHFLTKNLNVDLKFWVDRHKKTDGQIILCKDHVAYHQYKKAIAFWSNTALIGFSTADTLSGKNNQRIYDFTDSAYKGSNIFSVFSRWGFLNRIGPVLYTMSLFYSIVGHKKNNQIWTSVSYGLANRFLLSGTFGFEVLLNFSGMEDQAKIMTRILYFDSR